MLACGMLKHLHVLTLKDLTTFTLFHFHILHFIVKPPSGGGDKLQQINFVLFEPRRAGSFTYAHALRLD